MAHYEDITPDVPPANEPAVYGEWWGCKYWMVKAGTPCFAADEVVRTLEVAPPALVFALAKSGSAVDAQLEPARWSCHSDGHPVASIPIGARAGYAVNPLYLTYAAATAGVEEWRWLPTDDLRQLAGVLVGLRNEAAVAVVCPLIWTIPADPKAA